MDDPMQPGSSPHPSFQARHGTVLRPRPGAGRRPAAAASARNTDGREPPQVAKAWQRLPLGPVQGLNPLLSAAAPLLLLAGQLHGQAQFRDMNGLRSRVLAEIKRFKDQCRQLEIADRFVIAASYALCAVIDEAALPSSWEAQGDWAQYSLLMEFHEEATGGTKFFDVLEGIKVDPAQYIDLMELMYACLAVGFQGMFAVADDGNRKLEKIQQDLYQRIRDFRGPVESQLAPHWQGEDDRRRRLIHFVPWWVVGAGVLVIVAGTFLTYRVQLARAAAPLQAQLARIGVDDFSTVPVTAQSKGLRLRELLAAQVQQGTLVVEEEGGRTRLTLVAPNLFAPASAAINVQYVDTLRDVGAAMNQVPGRILVVGHTDDQPLKSLKYGDNFELSRERARSVVAQLKVQIRDAGRIEATGVGSTQPRSQPASTTENRARNRRVEIVHVEG
jgi:type VI secretion system protein ImpK